jgi:hypothetical protein
VPASHYFHPEFGFFCPTPRFRRRLRVALACLVVAGVGAAVMATADGPKLAAPVTRADEPSLAPFAAVVPRLPIVAGAQTTADKPSCVGDTGPKATVFPSSCASRAWFGWRTIAQQSLPLLSAAARQVLRKAKRAGPALYILTIAWWGLLCALCQLRHVAQHLRAEAQKSRPATFGHCRLSSCFMPGLLSPRCSIQDKVLMLESTKAGENVG